MQGRAARHQKRLNIMFPGEAPPVILRDTPSEDVCQALGEVSLQGVDIETRAEDIIDLVLQNNTIL